MFTILLSVLLFSNVQSAPTPASQSVPWNNLKNDQSLQRFQSTLLNQTLLTFLNDCYPPKLSSIRESIPCSRYFDGVLQLNDTNFVVQNADVLKILSASTTYKNVCAKSHSFPPIKYYNTDSKNLSDAETCGFLCIQEMGKTLGPKPICVFLAWMGEQLDKSHQVPGVGEDAVAAGNPASRDVAVNATLAVHKLAEGPVAKSEDIHKPSKDMNITQTPQQPVQPVELSNKLKINQLAPAAEVSIPKVSIPSEPVKTSDASIRAQTIPVEKIVPPAPVKEEKSNPTENHEVQGEETSLKDTANPEKHDSIPLEPQANDDQFNLNESDDDLSEEPNPDDNDTENAFDNNPDKVKSNDVPIVNPEDNEINQKSQEILDHNYLSNTKRVTDPFLEETGSNFFTYFLVGMFLCIAVYVVYHNKSKILALLLEGRRSDKGRGRRKHTAAYRKLDSNLEEAITSSASGRTTQIIY